MERHCCHRKVHCLRQDSSCSCAFRSSHRLPCRHIFARRQMSGKSSFDATLADKRWTAGYSIEPTSAVNTVRVSETVSTPALTAHQKYRQAMAIATDLANRVSEVGMSQFSERLNVLRVCWHCPFRTEWTMPAVAHTEAFYIRKRRILHQKTNLKQRLLSTYCNMS